MEYAELFEGRPFTKPLAQALEIIGNLSEIDQIRVVQLGDAIMTQYRFVVVSERLGLYESELDNMLSAMSRTIPIFRELGVNIPIEVQEYVNDRNGSGDHVDESF